MDLKTATGVAKVVCRALEAHCQRIEPAGSVRREVQSGISDVDIVAVPNRDQDVFGQDVGLSHGFIDAVAGSSLWTCATRAGIDSKFVSLVSRKDQRLKIGLYLARPYNFGWIMFLRTGPADFTKEFVSQAQYGPMTRAGLKFVDETVFVKGNRVQVPEEVTLFDIADLSWIAPMDRSRVSLLREVRATYGGTSYDGRESS